MCYMSMNVYHNVLNWDTKTINIPFALTENNGLGFQYLTTLDVMGNRKPLISHLSRWKIYDFRCSGPSCSKHH